MKATSRLVLMAACMLAAAGCGSISDYSNEVFTSYYDKWFGGKPAIEPRELDPKFVPTAKAAVLWKAQVGAAKRYLYTPMITAEGGGVFVADAGGRIQRFDLATGRSTLSINAGGPLSGGVGGSGRMVLAGTPNGEVLAWDLEGKALWRAQLTSEVLSAPSVDAGVVAARSADNRIFALDAATGAVKWSYQRPVPTLTMRTNAGALIEHGGVIAGFPGGKLAVLLVENGSVAWEAAVALPRGANELERVADVASPPVIDGGQVCAVAFQGRVSCFDLMRGTPQWTRDISSVMGMAADHDNLYIADDKSDIVVFAKAGGAIGWKQDQLYGRQITAPAVIGDFIAVGDYQGYVHFLRRDDGSLAASVPTDGSAVISQPQATDSAVIVQTQKGGIYAITVQ